MAEDQEDEPQQDTPDPNVYQPDQDDDEIELDKRIRRTHERLKRMTIVSFPQINETFGCQDTLTSEGGFSTGWAVNYIDCGKQLAREGGGTHCGSACSNPGDCDIAIDGCNICHNGRCSGILCNTACFSDGDCAFSTYGCTACVDGACAHGSGPACGTLCMVDHDCGLATDGCNICGGGGFCSNPLVPTQGACCIDSDTCVITSSGDCTGVYFGDGSTCEEVNCRSAFCPSGTHWCGCGLPSEHCCSDLLPICTICFDPVSGDEVCCCCRDAGPPIGLICEF